MTIDDLHAFVTNRLKAGDNPNDIACGIEDTVEKAIQEWADESGWSLWGTGEWRIDTACSICGGLPGICGHEKDPKQIVLEGIEAVKRGLELENAKLAAGSA